MGALGVGTPCPCLGSVLQACIVGGASEDHLLQAVLYIASYYLRGSVLFVTMQILLLSKSYYKKIIQNENKKLLVN